MKRKVFTIALAMLAAASAWAYDFKAGDLYYNITDETAKKVEVTYEKYYSSSNYSSLPGAVNIPSTVSYNGTEYSVTSIGDYAFYRCSTLTQMSIPNSVTNIGSSVFEGTALYNNADNWTNNVLYIDNCLIAAKYLSYCEIIAGTRLIAGQAFRQCSPEVITIPNSVTNIGSEAFWGSELTQMTILATIPPAITETTFFNINPQIKVNIPESSREVYMADKNWKQLLDLAAGQASGICGDNLTWTFTTADSTLTIFGTGNMYDYNYSSERPWYNFIFKIKNISISDGVTSIGNLAFRETTLEQVTISNSVTSIGNESFFACYSIKQITIPSSVTEIGDIAFTNSQTLTAINVENGNTHYSSENGVLFNINKSILIQYPAGKTETAYSIPNSVTSLDVGSFAFCRSLEQITIPNSVTNIGSSAFYNSTKLNAVYYAGNVTEWCGITFDYSSANPLYYAHNLYINNTLITKLIIPNNVTEIKKYAFHNCTPITQVTIGNHVENIDYSAFYGCTNLDTITCLSSNPPVVSQSFTTIDPKTCKLYVPKTALMDYIQAPVWGAFLNMEGIDVPTETYLLNLRIGQGGSISHNGNVYTTNSAIEVLPEATTTLQIQATPGYEIGSVIFNGTDYTAQVSADGTLTLPALTENATLQVSFTQQSYTVAYYVAGSNAYFFTTVNYGETFRCHAAAAEGHSILSVTLNGTDITGQLGEDGLLEITNITENCTLIISTDAGQTTETTGTQQDAAAFRAWQSNGEVFVEHTQDMTGVALYDVNGRLLHQTETNGYGVLRMAAPGKIHIVRATYADGTTASQKVM